MAGIIEHVESRLRAMRDLYGNGQPGLPDARTAYTVRGSWSRLSDYDTAYLHVQRSLERGITRYVGGDQNTMSGVTQSGARTTSGRQRLEETISAFSADAAALAPLSDTPFGRSALLSTAHYRVSTAASLVRSDIGAAHQESAVIDPVAHREPPRGGGGGKPPRGDGGEEPPRGGGGGLPPDQTEPHPPGPTDGRPPGDGLCQPTPDGDGCEGPEQGEDPNPDPGQDPR